jgi:hypothetical protein
MVEQLSHLVQRTAEPSVSLYMPVFRAGPEAEQNPIRLRNLLRTVEGELAGRGMRSPDIAAFLAPVRALPDDHGFWRHRQDGLALFLDAEALHTHWLPFPTTERAVVGRRYFLLPLLPLFTNNGHFYILALSQNSVRLLEATRFTVGEIDLPAGVPTSIAEALGDVDSERGVQVRTTGPSGSPAVYYGHGSGGEPERARIARYLNELDKGLQTLFRDGNAPLVIAGVEAILPIYREVSNYAHVVESGPMGNPEALRPEELHAQAWPFVEQRFRAALEGVLAQYGALAGTGRTGLGLEEIVPAAAIGRVESLLLHPDQEVWGTFDTETGRATRGEASVPGALELAGFAAAQTLLNGGALYAVEPGDLPEEAEAVAVFRY